MLIEYFLENFYSIIGKPLDKMAETIRKADAKESKENVKPEEEEPKEKPELP